ncbi:hypothetical protein RF11_00336 [Thelohanellus kitauei]|uniref:Uncharacterized protein n=1 Tax=Thelohanellus kitauei TaxID=669202 RepID=A0A0C2MUD0_THEKT|nr:hypothetical protein RF11_00336 [Thelohanellus kitauei]
MDFEDIRPKQSCGLENLIGGSPCNETQITDPIPAKKIIVSVGSRAEWIVNEESIGDSEYKNDPDERPRPKTLHMINADDYDEFIRICSDTLRHFYTYEPEWRKMFVYFRTIPKTNFVNKEESLSVVVADVDGNSRQNTIVKIINESICIMFTYNFISMIVWNPDNPNGRSDERKQSQKIKMYGARDILNIETKTNQTKNNHFIIDSMDSRSNESNVTREFPVIENNFQVFLHQIEIMEDNSSFNTTKRITESTPVHLYKTELHSNNNVQNYRDVDTFTKVNDSANINYQNSKIESHHAQPLFDQGNDVTSSDTILFSNIDNSHLIFSDVNFGNHQIYTYPISDDSDPQLSISSIPDSYYEDDFDTWSPRDSSDFHFQFDTLSYSDSEDPDLQSTFLRHPYLGNNESEFYSRMDLDSVDSDSSSPDSSNDDDFGIWNSYIRSTTGSEHSDPDSDFPNSQNFDDSDTESDFPNSQDFDDSDPESDIPNYHYFDDSDTESDFPNSQDFDDSDPESDIPNYHYFDDSDTESDFPNSQDFDDSDPESDIPNYHYFDDSDTESDFPNSQDFDDSDPESDIPNYHYFDDSDTESDFPNSQDFDDSDPESDIPNYHYFDDSDTESDIPYSHDFDDSDPESDIPNYHYFDDLDTESDIPNSQDFDDSDPEV